ncbi:hypothetical protein OG21DRAFT_142336 [Imleria badia]|nr:hypothetical protein OG21DRAFT_142336 [Imleria badia]
MERFQVAGSQVLTSGSIYFVCISVFRILHLFSARLPRSLRTRGRRNDLWGRAPSWSHAASADNASTSMKQSEMIRVDTMAIEALRSDTTQQEFSRPRYCCQHVPGYLSRS